MNVSAVKKRHYKSQYSIDEEMQKQIRSFLIYSMRRREASTRGHSSWTPHPKYDGGVVNGRKYQSLWKKAATLFRKHQLPIAEYIDYVVFAMWKTLPHANMILSSKAVTAFNNWRAENSHLLLEQIRVSHAQDQAAVQTHIDWFEVSNSIEEVEEKFTREEMFKDAVLDELNELSALYRFCLAAEHDFRDLRVAYFPRAVIQYMPMANYYDIVYGKMLPDSFKSRAPQVFLEELR